MASTLSPANAYHASGVGHCNGADLIHYELVRRNAPITDATWVALQSILGFAAENTLKCYLSHKGVSKADLSSFRKYGHDLRKLLHSCIDMGLHEECERIGETELVEALSKYIEYCGEDYGSFSYRYFEGKEFTVMSQGGATNTLIAALRSVLDIVRSAKHPV